MVPEPATDNPNERYVLDTWSSTSDVDTFFNRFNHNNSYCYKGEKLKLGDCITINDGTYNVTWMIAGFDMEHNRAAADGTVYDNGYGICMIPRDIVIKTTWNASDTLTGAYKSSTMHTTHLPGIVTKLQTILGSHIIQRNVLLSSSVDSNYRSNAYTWTTAYATLMSISQMTGTSAANKYDDGEANYKLPIFNSKDFKTGSYFWSRGVWGYIRGNYLAWGVDSDGSIRDHVVSYTYGVRPLIYLR